MTDTTHAPSVAAARPLMSHEACAHPCTKAGRAKCRAALRNTAAPTSAPKGTPNAYVARALADTASRRIAAAPPVA